MTYTVTLAIFPPWKAPRPYKTLDVAFGTTDAAVAAGKRELAAITQQELAAVAALTCPPSLLPLPGGLEGRCVTTLDMALVDVHGLLIRDESGTEVFNWTTWDEAVERASRILQPRPARFGEGGSWEIRVMIEDWMIAFVAAPLAVVMAAGALVWLTGQADRTVAPVPVRSRAQTRPQWHRPA